MSDFAGQRAVVMGLGRFGGGVGVARFLAQRGADVLVTDLQTEDKLADSLKQLQGLNIRYRLGGHDRRDFSQADLLVVNPAVDPRNNPYIEAARLAGVTLTSEIRLFVEMTCMGEQRRRSIGVTGTAGKSTTTAMIGHILEKYGKKVWVGGNLGGSLLDHVDQIGPNDWIVMELSSFMLETIGDWSPHIAVVTNIKPNHLDRHGHLGAYVKAKQAILRHQHHEDRLVVGPGVDEWRLHSEAVTITEDEPLDMALPIPGEHNQMNARLAVTACESAGVPLEQSIKALLSFRGLEHRLQLVHESSGVRFYDDSKCTTPEGAILAVNCFTPGSVRIILGGYDKHSDLTAMARHAAQHCAAIYTIGATGPKIADVAQQTARQTNSNCEVYRCDDLATAMSAIAAHAEPGDVVLLSPGCASWDQFDNFEQRGKQFAELARQLTRPAPAGN